MLKRGRRCRCDCLRQVVPCRHPCAAGRRLTRALPGDRVGVGCLGGGEAPWVEKAVRRWRGIRKSRESSALCRGRKD